MLWSSVAAQWCCNMIVPLVPLATLGNTKQIGPFLFVSCHPRTVACRCCWSYHAKLCQCKIHAVKLSSSSLMLEHDVTFLSSLGHLGQSNTDKIISVCVMAPKVAMASTVACSCCWCYLAKLCQCTLHAVKLSSSSVMLQHDITLLSSLGHLGQSDTDRIISICVMSPKVAMASTVACRCCWCYHDKLCKWKYIQWSSAATLSLQQWKPSSYLLPTKEVFFALFIRLFVEKIGAGILHKLN